MSCLYYQQRATDSTINTTHRVPILRVPPHGDAAPLKVGLLHIVPGWVRESQELKRSAELAVQIRGALVGQRSGLFSIKDDRDDVLDEAAPAVARYGLGTGFYFGQSVLGWTVILQKTP